MRLRELELTDFGPYRGTQQFRFSEQPGVELLWGENGRGKTSFLNAIRWALFQRVLGRSSTRIDPRTVGNREDDDADTVRPFKVVLFFDHAGHDYKLTRAYRAVTSSNRDSGAAELEPSTTLLKDGDVLGPEDRDRELATLLPEQVARFFLFDGELLQDYEQLLTPGSSAGEKLKAAIERLLGLPVLTKARDDVAAHLEAARKAQARVAQRHNTTRSLGNDLQLATEAATQTRDNVAALKSQFEELQNDCNEYEKQLSNNNRYRMLLGERNNQRAAVDRQRRLVDDAARTLADVATETWRAVLAPVVDRELDAIENQTDAATAQLEQTVERQARARAVIEGACPTCRQHVDADTARALSGADDTDGQDSHAVQARLGALRARRDVLRRLRSPAERLGGLDDQLAQARVDLSDAQSQLDELDTELSAAPAGTADTITTLLDKLSNSQISRDNTRTRLQQERDELEQQERTVATLSEKLAQLSPDGTGAEDHKVAVLASLHQMLAYAVTDFRDRLRDAIEDEATKVFRLLSAEADYDRLRINDQYGLTILHTDGTPVINRSSGYEHVVALSLIAALQRCAPMNGPIITDSPFGRLDATHKRHVLQALPQITDQVMLLVHDEELDRRSAVELLDTHLVGEHHLHRVSPRNTVIEPGAPS